MPDAPQPGRRKLRTRQHVIADVGVNFVERQVLLAGFTADRLVYDYGIDLMMKTYTPAGEVEPGHIAIQVKATDHFTPHADGITVPVRVAVGDIKAWLLELLPVVLIFYDVAGDRAFWLDVQDYAKSAGIDEDPGAESVTFRVPLSNVFDGPAVVLLRGRKAERTPPGS